MTADRADRDTSAEQARLADERAAVLARLEQLARNEEDLSASQAGREVKTDITSGEGDSLSVGRGEIRTLTNALERRLEEIDAAVAALDAGDYGVCAGCGEPIAPERLEALPGTTRCVTCAATSRGW